MKLAGIRMRRRPSRRTAVLAGAAVLWTAGLLGAALPAWQRSLRLHREIDDVERSLAALEPWTVAGPWLERALARREPVVVQTWSRLFPAARQREQLFLDLARIADTSGVAGFALEEISGPAFYDAPSASAPTADAPPPPPDGSELEATVPAVTLDSYRVRARFVGDFERTAAFLGGLRGIERAVNVTSLIIRPTSGTLNVEMELDVYVDRPTQS